MVSRPGGLGSPQTEGTEAASTGAASPAGDDGNHTPQTTQDLIDSTPDARADRAAELAPAVAPEPDTSGRRIRAIPTHGGSTVSVSKQAFSEIGIDHDSVVFDFRKDKLTLAVGTKPGQISEKAAEALHKHEPTRFEFINE